MNSRLRAGILVRSFPSVTDASTTSRSRCGRDQPCSVPEQPCARFIIFAGCRIDPLVRFTSVERKVAVVDRLRSGNCVYAVSSSKRTSMLAEARLRLVHCREDVDRVLRSIPLTIVIEPRRSGRRPRTARDSVECDIAAAGRCRAEPRRANDDLPAAGIQDAAVRRSSTTICPPPSEISTRRTRPRPSPSDCRRETTRGARRDRPPKPADPSR
jgi:hypothetical protein